MPVVGGQAKEGKSNGPFVDPFEVYFAKDKRLQRHDVEGTLPCRCIQDVMHALHRCAVALADKTRRKYDDIAQQGCRVQPNQATPRSFLPGNIRCGEESARMVPLIADLGRYLYNMRT